jgi:hypothetical protein
VLLDPQSSRAVSRTSGLPNGLRLDLDGAAPRRGLRIGGRRSIDVAAGHGLRNASACAQEEKEEEMKVRRIFRANRKTAEERAREHKLRDKLQKEKPSLEDLVPWTNAADSRTVISARASPPRDAS